MPPGRKLDLDTRIPQLIAQRKAALVGRARPRTEAQVGGRVAALVAGLERLVAGGGLVERAEGLAPVAATPALTSGGRTPRTAASRAAQAVQIRAVWARRRGGKPAETGGMEEAPTSEHRAARGAKVPAGRMKRGQR